MHSHILAEQRLKILKNFEGHDCDAHSLECTHAHTLTQFMACTVYTFGALLIQFIYFVNTLFCFWPGLVGGRASVRSKTQQQTTKHNISKNHIEIMRIKFMQFKYIIANTFKFCFCTAMRFSHRAFVLLCKAVAAIVAGDAVHLQLWLCYLCLGTPISIGKSASACATQTTKGTNTATKMKWEKRRCFEKKHERALSVGARGCFESKNYIKLKTIIEQSTST